MSWQIPALADHNYSSRPPTPPPVVAPQLNSALLSAAASQHQQLFENAASANVVLNNFGIAADLSTGSNATSATSAGPAPAPSSAILPPSALSLAVSGGKAPNMPPGSTSIVHREYQNSTSIEEAGVGPMTPLARAKAAALSPKKAAILEHSSPSPSGPIRGAPLLRDDDDNNSASPQLSNDRSEGEEEEGEDTETAPEAEGDDDDDDLVDPNGPVTVARLTASRRDLDDDDDGADDSITRCICDFLHDDGYMICCDKCSVWQHVVCMGLDKHNIPDEYLCEVCKPRPIDRKRAKALQSRRRTEIAANSSSSEDSNKRGPFSNPGLKGSRSGKGGKKILDRKNEKSAKKAMSALNKLGKKALAAFTDSQNSKSLKALKDKAGKKTYRKRKPSEKENKKTSKRLNRRKSMSFDKDLTEKEDEDEDDEDDEDALLEPQHEASQHLRSWIDQYEEAVTNHYSQELRARLAGNKLSSDLRPSTIGGAIKCNVSLKGNGVKILTANGNLSNNTPVIECKGKFMLFAQYKATFNNKTPPKSSPFVLFHRLSDNLDICLDSKTYGNDSRFCRRAKNFNAELRHVIDKGSLHLFIVTLKSIEKNQEIILPPDTCPTFGDSHVSAPLPSINADLREIKNGLLEADSGLPSPSAKDKKKRKVSLSSSSTKKLTKVKKEVNRTVKEPSTPTKKTRQAKLAAAAKVHDDAVNDIELNEEPAVASPPPPAPVSAPISAPASGYLSDSQDSHGLNGMGGGSPSPSKSGIPSVSAANKASPSKQLGLPDNSGLIVGVNTINYDASSSLKNKAKSREERKMEMIMKAIEAMEKAEQRKKEHPTPGSGGSGDDRPVVKRRRSSSSKPNNDSALEASSADEGKVEPRRTVRKKGRKSGPGTPQRRRSRVLSGGSASAMSESENNYGANDSTPGTASSTGNGPFRFPKTKKMMMSDWLQESEAGGEPDDDVSANYLRGSRSPPGIATHLLRAAPLSPVKNVCSAKKRWLRQAISEDHTEDEKHGLTNGGSPGPEAVNDYVTPLKKRRLENYKNDMEEDAVAAASSNKVEEPVKLAPGNLKKKLLQNMALEAMEEEIALKEEPEEVKEEETKKEEIEEVKEEVKLPKKRSKAPETKPEVEVKEEKEEPKPEEPKIEKEQREEEVVEKKPATRKSKRTASSTAKTNAGLSSPPPTPSSPSAATIKTPEPSLVFKSFFKPSVSLEELEAQIEASKRQRQASESKDMWVTTQSPSTSTKVENVSKEPKVGEKAEPVPEEKPEEKKTEEKKVVPETKPVERAPETKEPEKVELTTPVKEAKEVPAAKESPAKEESSVEAPAAAAKAPATPETPQPSKPKEKRRVSLADYKRRRKIEETSTPSATSSSTTFSSSLSKPVSLSSVSLMSKPVTLPPTLPTLGLTTSGLANDNHHEVEDDGSATPTMDEQNASSSAALAPAVLPQPATLNPLPLFEKLEQLEQKQKESKQKTQSFVESPVPEPKRENLAERLKKEFGVTVEDEESTTDPEGTPSLPPNFTDGGDSTPTTEDTSAPPTSSTSSSTNQVGLNRLPTNFPTNPAPVPYNSYPSYPPPAGAIPAYPSVPPYPKSSAVPRPYPSAGGPPHPAPFPAGSAISGKDNSSSPPSSSSRDKTREQYSRSNSKDESKARRSERGDYYSSHSPRGYYSSSRDRNRDRDRSRDRSRDRDRDYHRDSRAAGSDYSHGAGGRSGGSSGGRRHGGYSGSSGRY